MRKLTIRYKPDNKGWWFTSVKELKGCHTQGKTLEQARSRIEEALALFLEDLSQVELIDEVVLPKHERELVSSYLSIQTELEKKRQELQVLSRQAAHSLNQGLKISLRDTGQLMHLSHQRVNQLLKETPPK
ncbi:MAG: type II toxin-antitoxin system HicB family antitoxin [Candidatus Sericytochromatia bacterium]|nr:type II toxin-antitoxin system HicB family antitoxin [Candidatus Sericytochromatia bacterium]